MEVKESTLQAAAILCLSIAMFWSSSPRAQEQSTAKELPRPAEISGIKPEVLVRTGVPGVFGKIEIVTRVTYEPGCAHSQALPHWASSLLHPRRSNGGAA
jgi:hypothetical protein